MEICCRFVRGSVAVAAAAATTAAESTAAAATTATEATTTAATTEAAGLGRTGLGLVHHDGAAIELAAVESSDCRFAVGLLAHGDEAEAARAAGFTVRTDVDLGDRAECLERGAQAVVRRAEVQVSNVDPK